MSERAVRSRKAMPETTAVILAGGKSSRIRRNKMMLPIHNRTLIEHVLEQLRPHFDEVLISTNHSDRYEFPGVQMVQDFLESQGPLVGIVTAVDAARNDTVFVMAGDIPEPNLELVGNMLEAIPFFDCVVPFMDGELFEPLFAVYRKSVIPAAKQMLDRGERRVLDLFGKVRTGYVKMEKADWYRNLNTFEDYTAYLERLHRR